MESIREFRSNFYDRPFTSNFFRARIIVAVVWFFGTFALAGVINYERKEVRVYSIIFKILNGLSHMELTDYFITLLIALVIVPFMLLFLSAKFSDGRIIVGILFNEKFKKMKIRTRRIGDDDFVDVTILYSEAKFYEEKLSDGISGPMYDCITIEGKRGFLGYYFKNHKMWNSQYEIEGEINKIKRLV